MIRDDQFKISRRPYAVDLDSLRAVQVYAGTYHVTIDAAWFRRRRGVTVACVGHLWGVWKEPPPSDARQALAAMNDGRYGGECKGRWDGKRYWGSQIPDEISTHMDLLVPMLEQFPAVPAGYDGWWRYES